MPGWPVEGVGCVTMTWEVVKGVRVAVTLAVVCGDAVGGCVYPQAVNNDV